MANLTIAIAGDINWEVATRLRIHRFTDLTQDAVEIVPIEMGVGGTAAQFAIASRAAGLDAHLFARIGSDVAGDLVEDALRSLGVRAHLARDAARPTRSFITLWDTSVPGRNRLMLVGEDSANELLAVSDLVPSLSMHPQPTFFVTDAYCLLSGRRRETILYWLEEYSKRDVTNYVDIVPHDLDRHWSYEELMRMTNYAHVVCIE